MKIIILQNFLVYFFFNKQRNFMKYQLRIINPGVNTRDIITVVADRVVFSGINILFINKTTDKPLGEKYMMDPLVDRDTNLIASYPAHYTIIESVFK